MSTTEQSETATEPAPPPAPDRSETRNGLFALAMRLHFYAGVFVAPFILIAALTGALYAIAPTLEQVVNHSLLHVNSTGTVRPLSDQVAAGVATEPKLALAAVDPAQRAGDTTRVLFTDPSLGESEQRAVFVDPVTARPVGTTVVYGSSGSLPLRTWIDQLHRNLHLGQAGRLYSEAAASWLWVVALAGVAVWVSRARRAPGIARRLLWPDRHRTGRLRTMNWHATVGMWLLLPLLFLSATGMTWSTYAGAHVDTVRAALSWTTPTAHTALTASAARQAGSAMPGMDMPAPGSNAPRHGNPDPRTRAAEVDRVFAVARAHAVDGAVEITVPATDDTAYAVKQRRISGQLAQDSIAIDGRTGGVVDTVRFADWPLMAKLANWGIQLHMGMMFGLANQVLLLVTMLALVTVIGRGYLMWWRRRPSRAGRFAVGAAPRRGTLRRLPMPALALLTAVTVLVGWFAPVLGVSLLGFLAVDVALGFARRRAAA
ncbi:PepSY-associated TM helix domain-containing protein [Nocardia albiluteola]|nr:PepSY-associated TM helix domain-containing protein [Nocardia albiluteola]